MPAGRQPPGRARRLFFGSALLVVGASLGVVLGSLSDAPRVLLRAWLEPVDTVVIEPAPPEAPNAARAAAPPELAYPDEQPASVSAPSPEPTPAAPPTSTPPSAEQLIERIRESRGYPDPVAVPVPAPPAPKPLSAEPEPEPAPAPPRKTPPSGPVVQVAAYLERAPAEQLVRRLREGGFDAYISGSRPSGTQRYRVRVAPGAGEDANTLGGRLQTQGYDTWTTRE